MWLALASLLTAHAGPAAAPAPTCDVKGLSKTLTEAAPAQSGKAFADLAACDPAAANKAAPDAFKKILAGESGDAAVITAIGVGAGQAVREWVNVQEPDDRSRTISKLGEKCDQKGVPAFFLDMVKAIGDKFWTDRWYRGLDECRDPAIQELLRARISAPGGDRTLFFGVVEVFSRNLGKDAIPTLKAAALAEKDPEMATYLVNAFADATGVGSAAGANPEAVALAVAALNEIAPTLPAKAVDQARTTLLTLGAEADSDKLAAVRHKDVLQASGGLLYGVITAEIATCKKGDTQIALHMAQINDRGQTWPDQLADRIKESIGTTWKLDLGARCKGTSKTETFTPAAPFKDTAAYQVWVDATVRELQKKTPDVKFKNVSEDPLNL